MITYHQFVEEVEKLFPKQIIQRRGQFIFNHLYSLRPDLANAIRNTKYDCYHIDDLIPKTLLWLENHWSINE